MHSRPPRLIRTLPSLEKRREDLGNCFASPIRHLQAVLWAISYCVRQFIQ